MTKVTQPGDLLTEREVAAILKIARSTLANWRWAGKQLQPVRIGDRTIRYRRADVESFINGANAGKAA